MTSSKESVRGYNLSYAELHTRYGTGNKSHGYYYNWCAAMGRQSGTNACLTATTPAANPDISICPKNWRLPTGVDNGEFAKLDIAFGGTGAYATNGHPANLQVIQTMPTVWTLIVLVFIQ